MFVVACVVHKLKLSSSFRELHNIIYGLPLSRKNFSYRLEKGFILFPPSTMTSCKGLVTLTLAFRRWFQTIQCLLQITLKT